MSPDLLRLRDAAPRRPIKIMGVYAGALVAAVSQRVFGGRGGAFGQSFFGVRLLGVRATGQDRRWLLVTAMPIRAVGSVGDTVPASPPALSRLADFCGFQRVDGAAVEWSASNDGEEMAVSCRFSGIRRLMRNDADRAAVPLDRQGSSAAAAGKALAANAGGGVPPLSRAPHPPMPVAHGSDQILKIGRIAAIVLCRLNPVLSKSRELLPLNIGSGCGKTLAALNLAQKNAEMRGFKPCSGAANSRKVGAGVQRRAGLVLVAGGRHAMAGLG